MTITKTTPFATGGSYLTYLLHVHPPYVNQWNLSIQKQLATDWLLSANYAGNSAIHLWTGRDINPPVYIPGSSSTANTSQRTTLLLQNPDQGRYYTGGISELDDGGTASYNGSQLSIERRRSKGITIQGNYTYSHCITDLVNYQMQPGRGTRNYLISDNRRFDRGDCPQDIRHVFNVSTVYATPQFSRAMLKRLASDWQISGIVRHLTGSPFSVYSVDTSFTGNLSRADQVLANPYAPDKSATQWLNPAAFAIPALGTWGNMGRNTLRGPGLIQIDVGLTRTFRVRENQTLQFRVEAFNLPNVLNPIYPAPTTSGSLSVSRTDTKFGQPGEITTAADPRILQIALKYVF